MAQASEVARVPDRVREGWHHVETVEETVVRLLGVHVEARTELYEDRTLRERVEEATGIDRLWRFYVATRVSFADRDPGESGLLTRLVVSRVDDAIRETMTDNGFEDVRRRSTRTTSLGGREVELLTYGAVIPADGRRVPMEGLVAVWADAGYHVAGGGYPAISLADVLSVRDDGLDREHAGYRKELRSLLVEAATPGERS
ncbi:hypothetical protein [Natronorarus salvus]|uniref:hypothetical protein n=1 Tax=Natronorarus salvus TaxID=3117733 RepID=UPI002F26B718